METGVEMVVAPPISDVKSTSMEPGVVFTKGIL
jgi:hypothetical protein